MLVLNVLLYSPWDWGKQEGHNGALHPRDAHGESRRAGEQRC